VPAKIWAKNDIANRLIFLLSIFANESRIKTKLAHIRERREIWHIRERQGIVRILKPIMATAGKLRIANIQERMQSVLCGSTERTCRHTENAKFA